MRVALRSLHHGIGQTPIPPGFKAAPTCASYLANELAGVQANFTQFQNGAQSPSILLIYPGMTGPADAAQQVFGLASAYCQDARQQAQEMLAPTPSDCGDNGVAAANAAYAQWLAFYNSLPASVWSVQNAANVLMQAAPTGSLTQATIPEVQQSSPVTQTTALNTPQTTASPSAVSSTGNWYDWFSQSMISPIPNWALVAAGVVGAYFLVKE
jgi:hypothetical protein